MKERVDRELSTQVDDNSIVSTPRDTLLITGNIEPNLESSFADSST